MGGVKSNLESDKDSGDLLKHIENNQYSDILDKPEAQDMKDTNFTEKGKAAKFTFK
jgi:hypothetical protein